jgi:hypothetical protein
MLLAIHPGVAVARRAAHGEDLQMAVAVTRRTLFGLIAPILVAALLPSSAQAVVYGLKSQGLSSSFASTTPTYLFSFAEDGSGLNPIGEIKVAGAAVDADGLAVSGTYGLRGFELSYDLDGLVTSSTMLTIPSSASGGIVSAAEIGTGLIGREIRGATFASGKLWVVDAKTLEILQIDPVTGAVVGGPVRLKNPNNTDFIPALGTPHAVLDIAYRAATGEFYLVFFNTIYTVDVTTGQMSPVTTDTGQWLAGATFSAKAPGDRLFAYDVNASDDISYYAPTGNLPRSPLYLNFMSAASGYFDAGRGDLAATPEPASILLLATTLAGLGAAYRRRSRRGTDSP